MDRCDECAFVYDDLARGEIATALRSLVPAYEARLTGPGADPTALRAHPLPETWSALEYACHVRDVLRVQRERLALALAEDNPAFEPMGRDERVTRDGYNEQDPSAVAHEIGEAASVIASAFEALDDDQWSRTGIYNWPTRADRSMAWLGRHTVHEGRHHLRDIDRVLAAVP